MKRTPFFILTSLALTALIVVGCSSTATPVPSKSSSASVASASSASLTSASSAPTVRPTSAPAQPTKAPLATATTAVVGYDGSWRGTSEPNAVPAGFTVAGNKIVSVNINWSIKVGTCSVGGGISVAPKDSAITGNNLVAHLTDSGLDFTFQGTFTSATEASGTIAYQGKHEFCGTVPPTQVKWSAKKEGGAPSSSSAAKVPTPSSNGSASKNLRAFFDAINAKNVDAALALVNDTITFNIASTAGMGKPMLKTYLQGQIARGVTYTLGDLDDQGDTVDFALKTGSGAMKDGNTASFDDDAKIDFLILR